MLNSQDINLSAIAFEDFAMREQYWHCVIVANQRPVTARLIPLEGSQTWVSEAQLYKDVGSQALMQTFGCVYKPQGYEYLALLTETASNNLAYEIEERKRQNMRYELAEIVTILGSCLEGLKAIYSSSLTTKGHGNLTPSSIFKTKDNAIKLGNFCSPLATRRDPNGPYSAYIHPNVIKSKPVLPWQVDVFDLGVLLLHLCELQEPLGINNISVFTTSKLYKERFRMGPPEYQNEKLVDLFSDLTQTNTNASIQHVLERITKSLQNVRLSLANIGSSGLPPQPPALTDASGSCNQSSQGIVLPQAGTAPVNPDLAGQFSYQSTGELIQQPGSGQSQGAYQYPALNPQVQNVHPAAMDIQVPCKDCTKFTQPQAGAIGFICPHCFSANRLNP